MAEPQILHDVFNVNFSLKAAYGRFPFIFNPASTLI